LDSIAEEQRTGWGTPEEWAAATQPANVEVAPIQPPVRKRRSRVTKSKQVDCPPPEEPAPIIPPIVDITPTADEIKRATTEAIAANLAKEATAQAKKSTADINKNAKEAQKLYDEGDATYTVRVRLCELLNSYRTRFQERLVFAWKKQYTPDMPLSFLENEVARIRDLLNRTGVPGAIASIIIQFVQAASIVGATFAPAALDYSKITPTVVSSMEQGKYDLVIDQLSVEYGHWLAAGPWSRMGTQIFSDVRDSQAEQFFYPNASKAYESAKDL